MDTLVNENANNAAKLAETPENFNDDQYRVMFLAPEASDADEEDEFTGGESEDDKFTLTMSPNIQILDGSSVEEPTDFGTIYNLKFRFFVPNQESDEARQIEINMTVD